MYVTVYNNVKERDHERFIRLNKTCAGALEAAVGDCIASLENEYANASGTFTVECVEAEDDSLTSVVRIINPTNGYEYEAYLIERFEAGQ